MQILSQRLLERSARAFLAMSRTVARSASYLITFFRPEKIVWLNREDAFGEAVPER
ncbi:MULTISPECIES: hypothetical protein [unclassified Microcoleus]|uniref:hypothetical protein n=1 Tax=unclassified Microcoleus TaxID=2642155 RepID=UPI002FD2F05D